MICKGFTFIIIYLTLSSFESGSSLAAKPDHLSSESFNHRIISSSHIISETDQIDLQEQKVVAQVSLLPQKSLAQTVSSSGEEPKKISRRWYLGAMALTTSISLLLIWILFKKPAGNAKTFNKQASQNLTPEMNQVTVESELEVKSVAKTNALENNFSADSSQTKIDLDTTHNPISTNKSTILDQTQQTDLSSANLDVVEELLKDIQGVSQSKNQDSIRRKAIWKLTQVGDYRSIEPLLKAMLQVGDLDRRLIIEAVTQISHRSFKPINEQLFTALEDSDPQVRLQAMRDLKNIYQFISPVITKIAQMQSDTDYEVRQTATQVLQQLDFNPLPTFNTKTNNQAVNLVVGEESKENLHLVAYLLAELDVEG